MTLSSGSETEFEEIDQIHKNEIPTHARVKYIEEKTVAVLPVESIQEFKKFPPQNLNDFDKTTIYTTVYTDNKNPDGVKQAVLISDLAVFDGAEDEDYSCIFKGRAKFSKVNDSDLKEYYDNQQDTDESEDSEIEKKAVKKKTNKEKKSLKKIFKDNQKQVSKQIMENKLKTLDNVTQLTFSIKDKSESCSTHNNDSVNNIQVNEYTIPQKVMNSKLSIELDQLKQSVQNKDDEFAKIQMTLQETIDKQALSISKMQIEIENLKKSLKQKDQELTRKEIELKNKMDEVNKLTKKYICPTNSTVDKQLHVRSTTNSAKKNLFGRGIYDTKLSLLLLLVLSIFLMSFLNSYIFSNTV